MPEFFRLGEELSERQEGFPFPGIDPDFYKRAKAQNMHFLWKEEEKSDHKSTKRADELPPIMQIDTNIFQEIIECKHKKQCEEQCTGGFKITPPELEIYKKLNVPIPDLCPNCRHYKRVAERNPMKLWHRQCMRENCNNEFETSYAPDRPEIVYCEQCYQAEVV